VSVDQTTGHAMTFGDLFRSFHADPAKVRAPKTRLIYDGLLWITSSLWGEDRLLTSIDRAACRDLLELLRWLPSNPVKRFPSLNAVQAAKMAKKTALKSTLSAGSINGYMAKLRALMTFAVNEGWIDKNPATGLNVIDPIRDKDKRRPFSADQLRSIFHAPIYTGCVDDEWHYASPGPNRPRRARFWVPLIGLFSGLRLNEICQLDLADIQTVEDVACFVVRGDPTGRAAKRLKTTASERLVPIHPMLLQIGLLDYAEEQRSKLAVKLFPELKRTKDGYHSDGISKWFRRFLRSANAEAPLTCFHSFRHCFRDALREGRVPHDIGLALGGWAVNAGQDGAERAYGSGYSTRTLFEGIAAIRYPGLRFDHLLTHSEAS
jgi:integrase